MSIRLTRAADPSVTVTIDDHMTETYTRLYGGVAEAVDPAGFGYVLHEGRRHVWVWVDDDLHRLPVADLIVVQGSAEEVAA